MREIEDPIQPLRIDHCVDEIFDQDGELEQLYNYLVYQFERDGMLAHARAYLDTMDHVSLFGPYRDHDPVIDMAGAAFKEAVMGYLKRRFARIQVLGAKGYETIWRA